MPELGKTITLKRGIGLSTCMLIGTGILALPGLALGIGNVYEVILGWLLISLITIPRVQICARLGLKFPSTAGVAGYAEKAVGPWGRYSVSYLVAGSFLFGLPAVSLIGGQYIQQLFLSSNLNVTHFAILLATLMLISNLFGTRVLTLINYFAVGTLFLLLSLLIVFNLDFLNLGFGIAGEALSGSASVNPKNIWNISVLLFWAFLGWENLSFSLGEIENPEKNVPKLYWFSFVIVAAIYILLALISVGASASGVALKGAAGLSSLVLLTPGGNVLVWLIIFVIAANACSWNFTASRLLYAGGKTGIFPAVFGKLSKKNVPVFALTSLYTLSVLLLIGTYLLKISLADIMLIVNQNFIFLCSFIILAYWRTEIRWERWVFAFATLLSLSILASGFTWKAIYPLFLIGLGYFRFLKHTDERVKFKREFKREIKSKIKRESIQREDSQERSFLKD